MYLGEGSVICVIVEYTGILFIEVFHFLKASFREIRGMGEVSPKTGNIECHLMLISITISASKCSSNFFLGFLKFL